MGNTTADEEVGGTSAMAGPAGALLLVPLLVRSVDLRPGLDLVGSLTGVGQLANQGLVHHATVRLDAEDVLRQLDAAQLLAGQIEYGCLHGSVSPYARDARMTTSSPS